MAVWIYAYGTNRLLDNDGKKILDLLNKIEIDELKILDSIAETANNKESIKKYYSENRQKIEEAFFVKSDAEYKEYLDSVKYPYIEKEKLVDYFISRALEREKLDKELFRTTYDQFKNGKINSEWEERNNGYVNTLCNFRKHGALSVRIVNDLISISGSFEVFSTYGTFLNIISTESRDYYHVLFKRICKTFKSEFILYTHEWAGLDDEEDKGFNLKKLKEQSDWINTTSNSIHNMTGFYFEEINSKHKTTANKT